MNQLDTPTPQETSIEQLFEQEILAQFTQAQQYKQLIEQAKTSTKRKYFGKKLRQTTETIERGLKIYEQVKKQRSTEESLVPEEKTLVSDDRIGKIVDNTINLTSEVK